MISMFGVIGILFVATMLSETTELSTKFYSNNNMLALYSMIAFSLSAVMSVPQVVKGLEGDEKDIRSRHGLEYGTDSFNHIYDASGMF